MGQETNAALRRKLRAQRAAYEELLGLAGAIMAAVRAPGRRRHAAPAEASRTRRAHAL